MVVISASPKYFNPCVPSHQCMPIRGNNDRDAWSKKLPDILNFQINGIKLHVIHNVNDLEEIPTPQEFAPSSAVIPTSQGIVGAAMSCS